MSDKKTLLIVDDSTVSRMMIKAIISKKQPNWELLEAADGQAALETCQGKDIDYFSVDLNMPGIDGLELIRQLKPDYPDARMALLTANIQDATHQKAKSMDIQCINKPITEDSITQMIEVFI